MRKNLCPLSLICHYTETFLTQKNLIKEIFETGIVVCMPPLKFCAHLK